MFSEGAFFGRIEDPRFQKKKLEAGFAAAEAGLTETGGDYEG